MNYYLVRNGEAFEVDHDDLNRYPYIVDDAAHDAEEQYSDDWHLYETSGTEWCIAFAADEDAAISLADRYDRGEIEHGNVWCEVCGHAHGALMSPKKGRPEEMQGGKRRNVYIDDASWAKAIELGNGNASNGIRVALAKS